MTQAELEELRRDLRALRRAVDRHGPLLRQVTASNLLAILSLPFGLLTLAFGLGTEFLLAANAIGPGTQLDGSVMDLGQAFARLPQWWFTLVWVMALIIVVVGGVIKGLVLNRRASELGVGLWTVSRAFLGAETFQLGLATGLAAIFASLLAVRSGHAWYIVPIVILWYGIYILHVASSIRRPEYWASGWFGVASGAAALAGVESHPFLWLGIGLGGLLLVFGLVGILPWGRGSTARQTGGLPEDGDSAAETSSAAASRAAAPRGDGSGKA